MKAWNLFVEVLGSLIPDTQKDFFPAVTTEYICYRKSGSLTRKDSSLKYDLFVKWLIRMMGEFLNFIWCCLSIKIYAFSILNPIQYLRLQLHLIEMIIYRYIYKLIWHIRLITGCISTTSSFNNLIYNHFEIYRILKSKGSISEREYDKSKIRISMYDIKLNALPPKNLQVISPSLDNLPTLSF